MIFESCIAGLQVISVGIERNVPICSSATGIGQIYAYISIQIRSTMARCQLSVFRDIGSLVTILPASRF